MEENKPQTNNLLKIKTLKTYASDMADAVRENEASVIQIALAEQKRKAQEEMYKSQEGTTGSKIKLFIGGLILIILAVGIAYFVIKQKDLQQSQVPQIKKVEAYISYDNDVSIDLTGTDTRENFIYKIDPELTKVENSGSIKSIFLQKKSGTDFKNLKFTDFVSIANISAPGSFIRAVSEDYMLGTYQKGDGTGKAHSFLILKATDYNRAFAGMLEWEKTMLYDLFPLFHIDISGDNKYLLDKPFGDIIIDNKDARILYDKNGNDLMYYIFLNKDMLIITDSKEAIKEIGNRLMAKNAKPL